MYGSVAMNMPACIDQSLIACAARVVRLLTAASY
jgi:hypothetical protein